MLAKGNPEFCAILVAVNSILQIVLYAPFALFYLQVSALQVATISQMRCAGIFCSKLASIGLLPHRGERF